MGDPRRRGGWRAFGEASGLDPRVREVTLAVKAKERLRDLTGWGGVGPGTPGKRSRPPGAPLPWG